MTYRGPHTIGKAPKRWRRQDWRRWDSAYAAIEYCSTMGSKGNKIKYRDMEAALIAKYEQEERWRIPLFVYKCKVCHMHHLTKRNPQLTTSESGPHYQ